MIGVGDRPGGERPGPRPVPTYAVITGLFLAGQVALTDVGSGDGGQRVFWLVVGGLMLWLIVGRRSRLARSFVVVTSLLGGTIHALARGQRGLRGPRPRGQLSRKGGYRSVTRRVA